VNNAQIQSQDSNLELFEFIKSGSFKDLRKETSLIFTIKQTQTSQKNIVRKLICKNEECKVKAKIIQIGSSDLEAELHINRYTHLNSCCKSENVFASPEFMLLLKGKLKPSEIIIEFNKISDKKITNSLENRRKISQLKYSSHNKDPINSNICNAKELQEWLESHHQLNIVDESFNSLNWNEPFISSYEIYEDNFYSFATTKNLIYNIVKTDVSNITPIVIDGTYKLNNLGYPTIVLGTVDLQRKFHLSKFVFFNLLSFKLDSGYATLRTNIIMKNVLNLFPIYLKKFFLIIN